MHVPSRWADVNVSMIRELGGRSREAENPHSSLVKFEEPLHLDAGVQLAPLQIAYQTYGTLNPQRSNAILVCHALTLDQHVANVHPVTGKPGWWENMVGPGRPIDTERYFVICPNVLGACMGTTGPASTNPRTGQPWGLDFPMITVRDMVRAQAMLLDHLGIDSLFSIAGGSMGGMQVLQWASSYPRRVYSALPLATATRHSAQNIAFHEVGRQAVMADPEGRGGRYFAGRRQSATRIGSGPHGCAHHLSVGRGAAPQIRPAVPGPQQSDLHVRRRFPGRELSATPGHQLCGAVRREFLFVPPPRDGLFRPGGGFRWRPRHGVQEYADPFLRDLVHLGLAVSDLGFARHRARAQCRRRARLVRRDRHRQGP